MTEKDARKQGLAWWHANSIVEINLVNPVKDVTGRTYYDPNCYKARCLISGTFPNIEVLNETGDRHGNFPMPLFEGEYVIWREVVPAPHESPHRKRK